MLRIKPAAWRPSPSLPIICLYRFLRWVTILISNGGAENSKVGLSGIRVGGCGA